MGTDYQYIVKGRWPFPLDMLRYDGSHAATAEDQRKIDALSAEHAEDRDTIHETYSIYLVIPNAGRRWRPHTARWESFGWSVPNDPARVVDRTENARTERLEAAYRSAMSKLTAEEKEAVEWAVLRKRELLVDRRLSEA